MVGSRILIAGGGTGGHLVPALNLADALRRAAPAVQLLVVGAERGVERTLLPGAGVPYRLLPMEPLYRSRPWRNWRLLRGAPGVVAGLVRIFREFDPSLVVGTGGYASAPVVVWGRLSGRPTALQEQNAEPGLVTRCLAPHVDQVHLGYPEAAERLRPGRRTRVFTHGNPVARSDRAPVESFDWPAGRVVVVMGGSQGARALNEALLADLSESPVWPEDVRLVWIAGPAHAEGLAQRLTAHPLASRIRVVPFIRDLGPQLGRVTLAISRAGALTLAELAAAGVPAILVPLPSAAAGHQSRNAEALEQAGAAVRLEEHQLPRGRLWETARGLLDDPGRLGGMAAAMRARGRPEAADRIAAELLALARGAAGGSASDPEPATSRARDEQHGRG